MVFAVAKIKDNGFHLKVASCQRQNIALYIKLYIMYYLLEAKTHTQLASQIYFLDLGCARFPEFVQNFSECQILLSLCSVDFHTFTLQLPIQTLHSVVPELQVFVSLLENCQHFSKTSILVCSFNSIWFWRILKHFIRALMTQRKCFLDE